MSYVAVRWLSAGTTALAAVMLLASCAVGPDFVHPAAPEITRYTREPLAPQTSGADVASGQRQRFIAGRDIPKEWWAVFKSPALNALIERSLANNPNLQSTLATLRAAQQAVYAQEGKYFPLVQANFNPLRAQTAATLSPATASGANIYNLYTAQLQVAYTFDVWGLNRRAVESLQALADVQRFEVEAAYLALTSNVVVAAITEASLRGQIEATNQLIAINGKMLDIFQRRLEKGAGNASDVAVQAAALAQAKATLPPLRKALAQQRDLLAALSGAYTSDGPSETFRLANLHLPVDLPVSLPSQMVEQRPDVRAAEEQLHSASAQVGVATADLLPNFTISANGGYSNTVFAALISPQSLGLGARRQRDANDIRRRHLAASARRRPRHLPGRGMDLSRDRDRRGAERRRRAARAAKRCRCAARRARLRARRKKEPRSGAAATGPRPEQRAAAAHGGTDLSAGEHPGGAGASGAARRHRGFIPGPRRRLVEQDRAAGVEGS